MSINGVNIGLNNGRLAGFLYLVVVVTGLFSLAYIPSQIVLSGDPQEVASNIMASERLFRFGIASLMINQVAFLLLPLALFGQLKSVNEAMAMLMVAFAVTSVPMALVGLSSRMEALSLLSDARYAAVAVPQLQLQMLFALGKYGNTLAITKLFWGLWLFPFGYLVIKSGFLPKTLGVLLMLGCLGYMIDVFGRLLFPGYGESLMARFVTKPGSVGEIGTCLWLLIIGTRYCGRSAPPGYHSG